MAAVEAGAPGASEGGEEEGLVLLAQGAEARVFVLPSFVGGRPAVVKERFAKSYRLPELDRKLTGKRVVGVGGWCWRWLWLEGVRGMPRGSLWPMLSLASISSHPITTLFFSIEHNRRSAAYSAAPRRASGPRACTWWTSTGAASTWRRWRATR